MKLTASGDQQVRHFMFDASGTTGAGTPTLVLARSASRSLLYFKNTSIAPMWLEFDGPRATAVLTNGVVTSVTITNAGFGFSKPPIVRFLGGGSANNSSYLGLGQPNGIAPSDHAKGVAVMTGTAPNMSVASVTIDNGGSLYAAPPYVQLITSDLDPYGAALPAVGVGWQLDSNESIEFNGTACPTEAISVFAANAQTYTCKWMT